MTSLTALLQLALRHESSEDKKEKQVLKMAAGRIRKKLYKPKDYKYGNNLNG